MYEYSKWVTTLHVAQNIPGESMLFDITNLQELVIPSEMHHLRSRRAYTRKG